MKKISVFPSLRRAVLLSFVGASAAFSQNYTSGDWAYTLNNSNEATIVSYSGPGGSIDIPPQLEGHPVKHIGDGSLSGNKAIATATIPYGILSIGRSAFKDCSNLTNISIPTSVTSIGAYAFEACTSLTGLIIPNSVVAIGEAAFDSCFSIRNVVIPDSVTTIGAGAFQRCFNLETVSIGNGITHLPDFAFYLCAKLTSASLPSGLVSIGDYAFTECYALETLTIPASVTTIGNYAFGECTSMTSITFLGDAPQKGIAIFRSSHGAVVFYLAGGSGWTSAYAQRPTSQLGSNRIGDFTYIKSDTSVTIVAYDGTASVVSVPRLIENLPVKSVSQAFRSSHLTSVTLPDTITEIGPDAFSESMDLAEVNIPNSVTSIGDSAFSRCYSLRNITLPTSVTSVGPGAFQFCYNLETVSFGSGVSHLSDFTFYLCVKLKNVSLPPTLVSIGNYAFTECYALETLTIPASVTTIGNYAFSECTSMTSVAFLGDAPNNKEDIFRSSGPLLVYFTKEASGWGSSYAGRTTALLNGFTLLAHHDTSKGDVIVAPNAMSYALGAVVSVTAAPKPGYVFNSWSGDATSDQPTLSLSMDSSKTIEAEFAPDLSDDDDDGLSAHQEIITFGTNPNLAEITSPVTGLFLAKDFNGNRTAGQSDVINNPMSYGLYTSNSIMDLRMGGLMIQRNGTDAVVSFQPQTTTDLAQPFTNNGTPIIHTIPMPGNKGFIRINAKPVASPIPPQP